MNAALRIRRVQIWPLAIPMRFRFEHAAAGREVADPIIVQLDAAAPYAHLAGFGETLARTYVTGESTDDTVATIADVFTRRLLEFRPTTFAEALDFIHELPTHAADRLVNAARAAVELALIDLAGKAFRRRAAEVAGWLGVRGFGPPGCLPTASYSGIVVGRSPRKLWLALRLQRCYGLRDFKIKVAVAGWEERLARAYRALRRPIQRDRATLRADANGAWTPEAAAASLPILERSGVSALEQPLTPTDDAHLPALAARTPLALIADESLCTRADADRLLAGGGVQVLNIRIAKCGGLLPSLEIARAALAAERDVQLGCLVGETSILSAAGIAFLEICPRIRFVEGAYGTFLLSRDLARRSLRFGRGGRIAPRPGFGLGIDIDELALRELTAESPRAIAL